jgi:hypothetical protein
MAAVGIGGGGCVSVGIGGCVSVGIGGCVCVLVIDDVGTSPCGPTTVRFAHVTSRRSLVRHGVRRRCSDGGGIS